MESNIKQALKEILDAVNQIKNNTLLNKEIWTLEEFCIYAGISKHQAYHLTSTAKVKFYRPFGKMIYFDKQEVIEFLKQNLSETNNYSEKKSNSYLLKSGNN